MFFANIIQGITAYFISFGLVTKLKLWKYFIIPILISLGIGCLIGGLAYFLSDDIGSLLSRLWLWDWGKQTFSTIGNVIGGIFVVAIGLVLYKHLVIALASPFMSPVSEKIEAYYFNKLNLPNHQLITHRKTSFQEQLVRGVRISLRNITKELFFTVVLLMLGLIPVINIVTTPLIFLVQAFYAGFGNMDYTLERHFNYKDSIAFVKKNRGVAIGNGIVFMLLLFVPIVGFIIVMPLSVTASSIKTIEKINQNER